MFHLEVQSARLRSHYLPRRWLKGRIKGSITYVSTGFWYVTTARHILQHERDKYCPNSFDNHCNTPAVLNKNNPLKPRTLISNFVVENLSLALRRILFVCSASSSVFLWESCPPDPGGSNTSLPNVQLRVGCDVYFFFCGC